jgi:heme-degrading monooxygenase HmoA
MRGRCDVIVRLWRGRVPSSVAEEYRVYQEEVGPPGYRTVPGIRRIYMLGRDLGGEYEIAMLTYWDSLAAIRAFAGDPVDGARYYERDFDFLIDPPERVEHFDLLASRNLAPVPSERERIVRLWRGRTPSARKDEARRLETQFGIPGYLTVPGNAGVCQLGRDLGETYEVAMLTFWDSMDTVRAFAGDPPDRASYDEYRRRGFDYLSDAPDTAEHFHVLSREGAAGGR